VGPARTRLQATARRGLTRFVGRDAELEQLRRAQQLAAAGHGQIAALVGEAGVGKSRLVYEFTHSHRLQGWLVLESASISYGKATSYLPVIDLLQGYFKIQDRDDLREIREKVSGKLLTLDEALKPTLPALLALLDLPVDDPAWPTLAPAERRQRTLDAVKRLLLREAREQPLLVIFEDLHWVDGETQALLDGLVESLGSARLLLLVSYRPEYQHAWGGKTAYSQMRLDALPAESAAELLDTLLGDDPALGPLKQRLVKRGNPFFLEETLRTLVETKALVGERGRYRLTQPVQAIQVPATVQVMLTARIDRLPPEDKRLLQVASVVGKDVPFALLQAIAELPDEALRRGLDHLQAAEFLYETSLFPDLEYTFKHALTHEVTYGGLLQERRRDVHARIVDAIEALYRDRLVEQIERLTHHAVRGELREKAVHYLRQAGLKAAGRSAVQDARGWFEQALGLLEALGESPSMLEQAFEIRLELRSVLMYLLDVLGGAGAPAPGRGHRRPVERRPRARPGLRVVDEYPQPSRRAG
jgi:predicted ATPase